MSTSPAELRAAQIAGDNEHIATALRGWLANPGNDLPKLTEALELPEAVLSVALAASDFIPILAHELSALRLLAFLRNVELDAELAAAEPVATQARAAGIALMTLVGDVPV